MCIRDSEQLVPYGEDDTWSLLLHWSAKEVMFKCMNTPEVDFREHLHIESFTTEQQGVFLAHEYRTEQQRNFRIHYLIHPEFVTVSYTHLDVYKRQASVCSIIR